MKSIIQKMLSAGLLFFILVILAQCGKPRLFGKDQAIEPISKVYPVDPQKALQAAKEALALYGYNVQTQDDKQGIIETHWQPATSDSHYVEVFNRKDMGTVGAYHKLVIKVTPKGTGESQVEIYSLAKSIISNLHTTHIEENKVLTKIADFTRKPSIEVTNVGIQ